MSWFGGSAFDALVDKATSELLTSEDIALNLQICDSIRSKQTSASVAIKALRRRLAHKNPNVQLLTLKLLEMCVKNCGRHFLVEVASRDFTDFVSTFAAYDPNITPEIRNKAIELIQTWGTAFKNDPELSYPVAVYNNLKMMGVSFPPIDPKTSGIMLDTLTPPAWTDSPVCMRCRNPFTTIRRKHHCRCCGQAFCYQCSSKTMPLPIFGIEDSVRVCDGCYNNKGPSLATIAAQQGISASSAASPNVTGSASYSSLASGSSNRSPAISAVDTYEEDLRRALEISAQMASQSPASKSSASPASKSGRSIEEEEEAQLAAAIAASLAESGPPSTRSSPYPSVSLSSAPSSSFSYPTTAPSVSSISAYSSAPPPLPAVSTPAASSVTSASTTAMTQKPGAKLLASTTSSSLASTAAIPAQPDYDISEAEKRTIRLFAELIAKIEENGDSVVENTTLQDMYAKLSKLQPKLLRAIEETNRRHRFYADLGERSTKALQLYDSMIEQRLNSFIQTQNGYAPSYGSMQPPPASNDYELAQQGPPPMGMPGYHQPSYAPQDLHYPPQDLSTAAVPYYGESAPGYPMANGSSQQPYHQPQQQHYAPPPSAQYGSYAEPPPQDYGYAPQMNYDANYDPSQQQQHVQQGPPSLIDL